MIGYSESKANLHDPSIIAKGKRQVKPVVFPPALNLSPSLQDRKINERTCQTISPFRDSIPTKQGLRRSLQNLGHRYLRSTKEVFRTSEQQVK